MSSYVPVDTYKPMASLNDDEPVKKVLKQKKNEKESEETQPRRVLNIIKSHKKKNA
tara:strand:+ start:362 stop:529 length:168 start_codon:yes stop_codon:yes gene_type:complete